MYLVASRDMFLPHFTCLLLEHRSLEHVYRLDRGLGLVINLVYVIRILLTLCA